MAHISEKEMKSEREKYERKHPSKGGKGESSLKRKEEEGGEKEHDCVCGTCGAKM
jgi:hypothetical protein